MARELISPSLVDDIRHLIISERTQVITAVNVAMISTYWAIGRRIVEEEQQGEKRAEYEQYLIPELSNRLTMEFGKGFNESNLYLMRRFYLSFPILDTLCTQLSWSHYRLLLRLEKPEEISTSRKQPPHNGAYGSLNGKYSHFTSNACWPVLTKIW